MQHAVLMFFAERRAELERCVRHIFDQADTADGQHDHLDYELRRIYVFNAHKVERKWVHAECFLIVVLLCDDEPVVFWIGEVRATVEFRARFV